ncbi:MAG: Helicase associated domain protein [Paludibacteraceae bacterium]|nr:Helicase associated domain protein [Paludibacteraceae bacterium]
MSISLFSHNQKAYESLIETLESERRACIVHPTGTGKSFIGFKYCEDHLEQAVLWLCPSEYIFKTQCESLIATGAEMPGNITFMTYAKLSMLEQAELDGLRPDAVILDEMHRAAALTWEQPVQTLLSRNPIAIGLTATHIRYLDGQKDTTETFNMTVASQMTLGEAVVLGILNPPRYVLSIFSYQKDLEKYQRRIRNARNKAVKQAAEEHFEKLRRALENAEGLDKVFEKHMTDRAGKYLVFCSNAEHMDEMIAKVPEWFSLIDSQPRIYRAYADDPSTSKAFADFKADKTDHLKLLFCIDMLNEGIHVDDISGVILLRPTISPIVFKQQIGRAMAAGAKQNAVILDIVLNIENLYSISSIQEEIRAAITYYRYLGQYENIVNERFRVIDETGDSKRLFAELEQRLNCSWELMYAEAKKYYCERGNLIVPKNYKTETGLSLGYWLNTQRQIYKGKADGFLTDEQIAQLNAIGIVWDNYRDLSWEKSYLEAKDYYNKFGDLLVPIKYVTESGFPLGVWIMWMRQARANQRTNTVTEERLHKLEEIGMIWDVFSDQWERNYLEAVEYYHKHGNLLVPGRYISPNGIKLGNWIANQRLIRNGKQSGNLTEEQIERLEKIGMVWNVDEERWRIGYEAALIYSRSYGNLNVKPDYVTPDGFRLGAWIKLKRQQYKRGTLADHRIVELEHLGMYWDAGTEHWQEMYNEAKRYYEVNGNLKVPLAYKTASGYDLNLWLAYLRRKQDRLSDEQITAMNAIGMKWRRTAQVRV